MASLSSPRADGLSRSRAAGQSASADPAGAGGTAARVDDRSIGRHRGLVLIWRLRHRHRGQGSRARDRPSSSERHRRCVPRGRPSAGRSRQPPVPEPVDRDLVPSSSRPGQARCSRQRAACARRSCRPTRPAHLTFQLAGCRWQDARRPAETSSHVDTLRDPDYHGPARLVARITATVVARPRRFQLVESVCRLPRPCDAADRPRHLLGDKRPGRWQRRVRLARSDPVRMPLVSWIATRVLEQPRPRRACRYERWQAGPSNDPLATTPSTPRPTGRRRLERIDFRFFDTPAALTELSNGIIDVASGSIPPTPPHSPRTGTRLLETTSRSPAVLLNLRPTSPALRLQGPFALHPSIDRARSSRPPFGGMGARRQLRGAELVGLRFDRESARETRHEAATKP